MMGSWWFVWLGFMFLILLPPVGYGWGYRGWGAPYPRYVQRRRMQQASVTGTPSAFNHQSWGWGGDLFWIVLLCWVIWPISTRWWH